MTIFKTSGILARKQVNCLFGICAQTGIARNEPLALFAKKKKINNNDNIKYTFTRNRPVSLKIQNRVTRRHRLFGYRVCIIVNSCQRTRRTCNLGDGMK